MRGEDEKVGVAEGAGGVGGGRNGSEFFLEGSVLRCAEEMPEGEHGSDGSGEANNPAEDENIGRERHGPEGGASDENDEQAGPLETPARARVNVGIASADGAEPALVKAERENGNPENVQGVEAPDLHGAAGLPAREAVVVAEGDALLAEVVNAVQDEHASPRRKRGEV